MIKVEEGEELPRFEFAQRNRRPPRDPVNALLSFAYSLLAKDLTIVCHAVGFDPFIGFYHQPRFGRPALALDLMEGFRPLIADSAVLSAINMRMVTPNDFNQAGRAVAMTTTGRKGLLRAYEQRMDNLVTHPLFGYRLSYRRVLERQARDGFVHGADSDGAGDIYSFADGFETNTQLVPRGTSPIVMNLRLRRKRIVNAGQSVTMTIESDSSLCSDLEDRLCPVVC